MVSSHRYPPSLRMRSRGVVIALVILAGSAAQGAEPVAPESNGRLTVRAKSLVHAGLPTAREPGLGMTSDRVTRSFPAPGPLETRLSHRTTGRMHDASAPDASANAFDAKRRAPFRDVDLTAEAGNLASTPVAQSDARVRERIREATDLLRGRGGAGGAPEGHDARANDPARSGARKTAAAWSADHLLANATSMDDEYVSIAVSPVSGHLYAVFEATDLGGTDRDIHIARSMDDGATWEVWEMPSFSLDEYHPDIAIDAGGYILVTWIRDDGYVLRAKTAGPDDPTLWDWVHGLSVGEPCMAPAIAAKRQGSNGKVFIAASWYTVNWDLLQYEWTLLWMWSTDGGETIQFDYFVPDGYPDFWPDVALKGSTCYFMNAEQDPGTGVIDILVVADSMAGAFVSPTNLSDWTNMTCGFPAIASEGEKVYMVFQLDNDDGVGNIDGDIVYAYSWDGLDQVFGPYAMVSDPFESIGPTIFAKNGIVGCYWLDAPPGGDEFYLASRVAALDGHPDVWGEVEVASDLPYVNPTLHSVAGCISGSTIHAAWSDRRDFPTQGLNIYTTDRLAAPNLEPYVPLGWSATLTAADVPGERTIDSLTAGETAYVSFAFLNDGLYDITTDFRVRLTLDGLQYAWWLVEGGVPVSSYVTLEDYPLSVPTGGLHILGYELDFLDEVGELDESDNSHLAIVNFAVPTGVAGGEGATDGNSSSGGDPSIPEAVVSLEALPNPFNPQTQIRFSNPVRGHVSLSIYSPQGREVRRLIAEEHDRGLIDVSWDGRDDRARAVPSGVYFAKLRTPDGRFTETKLTLIR
ncbi:MAG: T9SS type A sorting domain-containing protein [Gemmatimonadetes bacterium]|nr:T9SS type A sorting domain-containing protein [Gemmatimonadota bacterium]